MDEVDDCREYLGGCMRFARCFVVIFFVDMLHSRQRQFLQTATSVSISNSFENAVWRYNWDRPYHRL